LLRNQGQILGEERAGDFVTIRGQRVGEVFEADEVRVIDPADAPESFDGVMGEIRGRTENTLHVADAAGGTAIVEVREGTRVEIPRIEGANNVAQLRHHLEIQRMSKSKGNVVSPDDLVAEYGADTVRAYLMFAFDWEKGGPWDRKGVLGVVRWIREVWEIVNAGPPGDEVAGDGGRDIERHVHQTIQRVQDSFERFSFNTAVAALMGLRNELRAALREQRIDAARWLESTRSLVLMMAPIAPHVAEELWSRLGQPYSVHQQAWPELDPTLLVGDQITLAVQVNGKRRDEIQVPADADEATIREAALASSNVRRHLGDSEPRKLIVVPGRLVNLIV